MTLLLKLLQKQNRLLTILLCLFTLHSILPLVTAQTSQPENLIVFDEVGQMAASMAYVHVAIPLNISTYQHQVTLFDTFLSNLSTKTTDTPQEVSFTKAIRDLATFAYKRLHKLTEKLRFIDLVLPEDDLSQPLRPRQKRFLSAFFMPNIRRSIWRQANTSINNDLYDSNCNPKARPGTSDWPEIFRKWDNNINPPLMNLYPIHFRHTRQKRFILQGLLEKNIQDLEPKRRQALVNCHLLKLHQTTTPLPYPDYPEFHAVFVNESFPLTTTTTTPAPTHQVFLQYTTQPPPNPYRTIRSIPTDLSNDDTDFDVIDLDYDSPPQSRSPRQILTGLAAAGGLLGTIFGIFNQFEMHRIEAHVSHLESSQNMLIQVAHKNTQNINALQAEIVHLDSIITTLIKYNPALVYAKLMSQVDDVADHLDSLLDTVQQLQHQKLSIKLLSYHQLHVLYQSVLATSNKNGWSLLIRSPQDIFQLDVSYIRRNADVIIMLHVPCLTDSHLLTIYRYANLPLPISPYMLTRPQNTSSTSPQQIYTIHDLLENFANPVSLSNAQEALHFVPETELIAVGRNDGASHRYKLLSHADLAACVQRNHVFLCEGHQVLRTDLEGSCLGAIYLQSERGVRENCKVERKILKETVFQISATDHLVVSPQPHTAQITCNNGSHSPVRIRTTTRVSVSPGCTLKLFNHTLRSDQSIRIKPEPLVFQWDFNPLALPSGLLTQATHLDQQYNQLQTKIAQMKNASVQDDEFPQILHETLTDSISPFSVLFWSTFAIAVLALGLLMCWYCGSRRRQRQPVQRQLTAEEMPMTISQIAELDLDDPKGYRPPGTGGCGPCRR